MASGNKERKKAGDSGHRHPPEQRHGGLFQEEGAVQAWRLSSSDRS